MKKSLLSIVAAITLHTAFAQDTTKQKVDTLQVGNYVIIKKPSSKDSNKSKSISISSGTDDWFDISFGNNSKSDKNKNVKTDWISFDLGFCNVNDQTNYAVAQQGSYFSTVKGQQANANTFSLINAKSSNFNFWFFRQRVNLYKQKLNLKWGLGYEMFNFRYENSLSFRNDPQNSIMVDTIKFSKNKLYTNYLTIPLMLSYKFNPNKSKSFFISAGVSVGYLIGSRNKQISNERGKQKIEGNFNLEPLKISAVGELGLGIFTLYGSYAFNNMFKSNTGLNQTPFAFGIRFSKL